MRYYELFNLTEDVASSFLGKESKLFQLFEEREKAAHSEQCIYDRQINYITTQLPENELKLMLCKHYSKLVNNTFVIKSSFNQSNYCALEFNGKKICMEAEGDLSAETIAFDLIKQIEGRFFAVNVEEKRFGWLKPYEKQSVL